MNLGLGFLTRLLLSMTNHHVGLIHALEDVRQVARMMAEICVHRQQKIVVLVDGEVHQGKDGRPQAELAGAMDDLDLRILLRAIDRLLHQIGDICGGLDGAVGDDVVLQLLGLYGLLIGGQEALDDRGQVGDHDQQLAVVGLTAQLVEHVLQRGLGLAHHRDQVCVAGGAELPGGCPQRVHLGIGLKQQTFDIETVVHLRHHRRTQLSIDGLVPFLRDDRTRLDLRQQCGLRLREIFHGGSKTVHQGLDLLQPLPRVRPLRGCERSLQFLRCTRLVALQVGNGLFNLAGGSRQPDGAGGKLNLAQVDMRGE